MLYFNALNYSLSLAWIMILYSPAPSALIQVMSSSNSQKSDINTCNNNTFEIGGVVFTTLPPLVPQSLSQYITLNVVTPSAQPFPNITSPAYPIPKANVGVIRSIGDYNVTAVESSHPTTKRRNNSQANAKSKFQKTSDESSESDKTELTHQSSVKAVELQPYFTFLGDANQERNGGINRPWMANEQHCEISPDTPKASRLDYLREFYASECNDHTAFPSMQPPPTLKNQSRLISRLQPESKNLNGSEPAELTSNGASSTNGQLSSNVTIIKFREGKNITQELNIKAYIQQQQYNFSVTVTARSDSSFIAIQCVLNTMIAHDNEYVTIAQIREWIKQNQLDLYQTIEPRSWTCRLREAISDNLKIFEAFSTSSKPRKYRLKTAVLKGEVEPEDSKSASSTDCQPSSNVTIAKRRKDKNNKQKLKIKALIKQKQCDFSVTVTARSDGFFIAIQCVLHAVIANDNEYIAIPQILQWMIENQSDLYGEKKPENWTDYLRKAISENTEIIEISIDSPGVTRCRLKKAILTAEVEPEGSNSASSTDCQPSSKVTIKRNRQGTNNKQKLKMNVRTKQQQYDFSVTVTARSDNLFIAIQCVLNAIIAHDNKYLTIFQIRLWVIENQPTLYNEKSQASWTQNLRNAISENTEIFETSIDSPGFKNYRLKQAILTGEVEPESSNKQLTQQDSFTMESITH